MEKNPYVYNLYIGFRTPFITYNWCLGPPCIVGISSVPDEKSQESIFSNSKPMVQTITLWVSSYLLMAEILHQLRLVVYLVIYRVLHPRWLFGIPESSTEARNSTPLFNPICLTFFRIHEGSCPVLAEQTPNSPYCKSNFPNCRFTQSSICSLFLWPQPT